MWKNQYQKSDYQVAILLTRLPFGSAPARGEFCITSENLCNLTNELIHCEMWYPLVLPSPYSQQLTKPLRLEDGVTFVAVEEADIKIYPHCKVGADGYIDDGATAVIDSPINVMMVSRAGQAVIMSLFIIFRTLSGALEPFKRPDPSSICKMIAKGCLKEIITFLGFLIGSCRFIIALPI